MTKDKNGERNQPRIVLVRGQQVMLGIDLAKMHRISADALDQAIARNSDRFPAGSMFRLTAGEIASLQLPAAVPGQEAPCAFTAEGVAALADVLFDERELHERHKTRAATCKCRK